MSGLPRCDGWSDHGNMSGHSSDSTSPERGASKRVRLERRSPASTEIRSDLVAVEEPLEIRIGWPGNDAGHSIITMRTPGDDVDLSIGYLHSEGLIAEASDVVSVERCHGTSNVVRVALRERPAGLDDARRSGIATSSCGVCGKSSLAALGVATIWPVREFAPSVDGAVLAALPEALRAAQEVFDRTGGLHAAALFTIEGELVGLREDVGRHNALDKLIGSCVRQGAVPLAGNIVCLSGRISYELVQKAARAGLPVIVAISAPSSLAVELARETGITLAGFTRNGAFNLYHDESRVR